MGPDRLHTACYTYTDSDNYFIQPLCGQLFCHSMCAKRYVSEQVEFGAVGIQTLTGRVSLLASVIMISSQSYGII